MKLSNYEKQLADQIIDAMRQSEVGHQLLVVHEPKNIGLYYYCEHYQMVHQHDGPCADEAEEVVCH